jgi:hypothetical protein
MTAPTTANLASEVLVGKPLISGGVYNAPIGTTVPVTATEDLDAAFEGVGYVVFGGVTQAIGASTTPLKAWGGSVVRVLQTEHNLTYAFGLMQTNKTNLGIYYGADSTTGDPDAGLLTKVTAAELNHSIWVIELKDGDYRGRIVIEDGQVTERGDVVYQDEDAAVMPITVTAFESGDEAVKATIHWIKEAGGPGAITATGATAGTPGTFTPGGAQTPANLAALSSVTASPASAWTTGQSVVLGDASSAHWNGTAWAAGAAA